MGLTQRREFLLVATIRVHSLIYRQVLERDDVDAVFVATPC
jgi:hypothetical protein